MTKLTYWVPIGLAVTFVLSACAKKHVDSGVATTIEYPPTLPDETASVFLPGLVSIDGLDFNAAFSPDGKTFYFTRSNKGKWDIYTSKHDGQNWSTPDLGSFSDHLYSEADPAFGPDGKLYFISNRPKDSLSGVQDFDIWYVEPLANERWSLPVNLSEVNSDSAEYYVSFSKNGNLYFGSSRAGGFGEEDIYMSKNSNGHYDPPVNLGPTINSSHSEHDPAISADEDFIVFKSEGRSDGYGGGDLYCSKVNHLGKWRNAVNLGHQFNTTTWEYCPYFTPDGKYFFFSSESDVKWIDLKTAKSTIDKLMK